MQFDQRLWKEEGGWQILTDNNLHDLAQLVLVFGATHLLENPKYYQEVKELYPNAHIVMCSTAGEIVDTHVQDNSIVATAVHFTSTPLEFAQTSIDSAQNSEQAGEAIAKALPAENLTHVVIFSDGLHANGTALLRGLSSNLPHTVSVTGGLVGDGVNFKKTLVGVDMPPLDHNVLGIGFYGEHIKVGYGSLGGWDTFGPERKITKSRDNILYELDDQPALGLYKAYLGDKAAGLPGTGLLFPLSLRITNDTQDIEVVRTLLGVNEADQSMTFAGDMPEGVYAKLMKANFERLIDGAEGAASMSLENVANTSTELALLISCVGRKLVLQERTEEEIEAVRNTIGSQAAITGFYSYGELCPTAATEKQCQLHNQTMTITTFREV